MYLILCYTFQNVAQLLIHRIAKTLQPITLHFTSSGEISIFVALKQSWKRRIMLVELFSAYTFICRETAVEFK